MRAGGHCSFNFSSQNLRDQAARLERSLGQLEQCIGVEQRQFNTGFAKGESSNGLDMSSTDTVFINESRYQNKMNESKTIAHDSYDDQPEIPRTFNHNDRLDSSRWVPPPLPPAGSMVERP